MNTSQAVAFMLETFSGRRDAYGSDDGMCVRSDLTASVMEAHLLGTAGIGVYPVIHGDGGIYVKTGCCDIDTGSWAEAWLLYSALSGMGLPCYVERSRSKGWHLWVFAEDWVPAATMRRALKVAYAAIDLPAKEANPKQETLHPHQLGNYVRLPYKGGLGQDVPTRQVVMGGLSSSSDGTPISLERFAEILERASVAKLEHWAGKWFEPTRHLAHTPELVLADTEAEALVAARTPRLLRLFLEGPRPKTNAKGEQYKTDKSEGLVGLARGLVQSRAFTEAEVWSAVASADRRWGKYHLRNNCESFISDIVSRGYL